jgi:hypothetical protein
LNADSPIFFSAVSDAIHEKFESWSWLTNAPSGAARFTTTVVSFGAVIVLTGMTGLHVQGVARSLFQLAATAWALNGVPSVNFTPERTVIVTVLPPFENLYAVARSGRSVPFSVSCHS